MTPFQHTVSTEQELREILGEPFPLVSHSSKIRSLTGWIAIVGPLSIVGANAICHHFD